MPERNRFLRGMTRLGRLHADRGAVRARGAPRRARRSTRCARCCASRFDAITSFSNRPLQFATLLGFVCSALAFLAIPLTVVARYANIYERGVPTTIVIVLLLGGIQLITRRDHRRVRRAHLRRGQAPPAVRRARPHQRRGASTAREDRGHRGRRRRPRRRVPARPRPATPSTSTSAGPGLGGQAATLDVGDGAPARALLPPPVHHRPPHRGAVRRARDAGRARVARRRASRCFARGAPVAVHDAAATCCASSRCRRSPACAWAPPCVALQRVRRRPGAVRARDRARVDRALDGPATPGARLWGPLLRGKFGERADDIAMVWLRNKLRLRARRGRGARSGSATRGAPGSRCSRRCATRIEAGGGRVLIDRPAARARARDGCRRHAGRARTPSARGHDPRAFAAAASRSATTRVLATRAERRLRAAARARRCCPRPTSAQLRGDRVLHRAVPAARARPPVLAATTGPTSADDALPVRRADRAHEPVEPERYDGRRFLYVANYLAARPRAARRSTPRRCSTRYDAGPARGQPGLRRALGRSAVAASRAGRAADRHRRLPRADPAAADAGAPGLVLANTTQIYPEDRGTNYAVRARRRGGAGRARRQLSAEPIRCGSSRTSPATSAAPTERPIARVV